MTRAGQWLGVGLGVGAGVGVGVPVTAVALGDGLKLGAGSTHGVVETLGLGEAETLAPGETEVRADALGLTLGPTLGLADGEAVAQMGGLACESRVLFSVRFVPPPLRNRATGTTMIPMKTVMTKAAAPHSRRQKAALEFRIRALRPSPAAAYCVC